MNAVELAKFVREEFGPQDVFGIAEKLGLSIVYAKWTPVTWGEFDRRSKTITVNENAPISFERIVAHELGHYFLDKFQIRKTAATETLCDDFAAVLLNDE